MDARSYPRRKERLHSQINVSISFYRLTLSPFQNLPHFIKQHHNVVADLRVYGHERAIHPSDHIVLPKLTALAFHAVADPSNVYKKACYKCLVRLIKLIIPQKPLYITGKLTTNRKYPKRERTLSGFAKIHPKQGSDKRQWDEDSRQ